MQIKIIFIWTCILSTSYVIVGDSPIFYQPPHFPKPSYDFDQNPIDSLTVELGRTLFYDPILSADNTISCASCHSPYNAFAHTDYDLSHGIFDSVGTRNAPALFNLAWQPSFTWDGAINHLDMQALAPIAHAGEMGSTIVDVLAKLNASKEYKQWFYQCHGDSTITTSKLLKALSQFQLTLVSAQSKYDKVSQGIDVFSQQEMNGYSLFKKNCNSCHTEPLFSSFSMKNNGLPVDSSLRDLGRYKVTQHETDKLKFKVPSLRNLSYTYPYMHDGRFGTLKEVINHYTTSIQNNTTISPELSEGIRLSSDEKVDLIAFLLTLNDKEFVFDKKHQFKKISPE